MPDSVFLHIGHSKTGSTTIQSLATDHREFMEKAGFRCPLTVNGKSNHGPLADALRDPSRANATLERFVSDLSVAPSRKVFLPAETLCEISEDGVRRLKNLIADHEMLVLLYIRDYPSWVTLRYAQAVRFATRTDDFDTYFKALRKRVSIVPALRRWAAAFGANAVHVRTLDPVSLKGGTLISDVLHAIGVESAPPAIKAAMLAKLVGRPLQGVKPAIRGLGEQILKDE